MDSCICFNVQHLTMYSVAYNLDKIQGDFYKLLFCQKIEVFDGG